jgi:hypothetical protein
VELLQMRGVSVVRLVDGPARWDGWTHLPALTLARARP